MTTSRSEVTALALVMLALPATAQELMLPSGLQATLFDVVLEDDRGALLDSDAGDDPEADQDRVEPGVPRGGAAGGLARFRLLVPGLGGEGAGYERVAGDFLWTCEALALPALAANGWAAAEVVVTLADREVPFGEADPEAVQFFEGFHVEGDACVPQAF